MKYFFICCVGLLSLLACEKKTTEPRTTELELATGEYLIFGRYGFECTGNCITVYKVQNEQLFADNIEYAFPEEDSFQTTPLSQEQYETALVLVQEFPQELLETEQRTFGCPDCADQGGIYLSLKHNGEVTTWQIDTQDVDQSNEILAYKARVLQVLEDL